MSGEARQGARVGRAARLPRQALPERSRHVPGCLQRSAAGTSPSRPPRRCVPPRPPACGPSPQSQPPPRLPAAGEAGAAAAVFCGLVSTNNSGGFTSVRSRNFAPLLDCSAYAGLELRVRGDGQRYKCIIRADTNWDGIAYCKCVWARWRLALPAARSALAVCQGAGGAPLRSPCSSRRRRPPARHRHAHSPPPPPPPPRRSFDTVADEWQTIRLPFSEFAPVFRAKTLKDGAPLDASSVASVQLMLSKFEYDGQLNPSFSPGPFELPIQSIRTYMPQGVAPRWAGPGWAGLGWDGLKARPQAPSAWRRRAGLAPPGVARQPRAQPAPARPRRRFVHVSSAGVTRPNRPGIDVEAEPPAVKLNDELGGLLTYKLEGEDALRCSGLPYSVVRPCALTEEPAGAPLQLDQGERRG